MLRSKVKVNVKGQGQGQGQGQIHFKITQINFFFLISVALALTGEFGYTSKFKQETKTNFSLTEYTDIALSDLERSCFFIIIISYSTTEAYTQRKAIRVNFEKI